MIFWPSLGVAYANKRRLQALLERRKSVVAKIADHAGSGHAMLAYGVAVAIVAACKHDPKLRAFVRRYAKAGARGFVMFQASRFVLAERRPKEGGEMRFFRLHGHGVSGHTFAAALVVGPIMETWGPGLSRRDRALLSAMLHAWVAFIAWSRVALGEHYVWNTMLGARLGLRVGRRQR